jgi:hypothetical protein
VEHLSDVAKGEIFLPDEQRIASIKTRRWYPYPRAQAILTQLTEMLDYPKGPRMPSVALIGDSGNGKTTLLERFHAMHPAKQNTDGEGIIVPVLMAQGPPGASESQFYNDCLKAISAIFSIRSRPEEKRAQLIDLLQAVRVRMLVIDELHTISKAPGLRQQTFLEVIKYLSNKLSICVVVAGNEEVLSILAADKQINSRFAKVGLPEWRMTEDFLCLLDSVESRYPLRKGSNLAGSVSANLLLRASGGSLGLLLKTLECAGILAIKSGQEKMTPELLRLGHKHAIELVVTSDTPINLDSDSAPLEEASSKPRQKRHVAGE